ncbi:peptidylprolyl isomerase [Kitasatospora sp. NPDC101183]|uniref:peptidylprolyl isomerase n=1 Tax=Kitasatospora sp. NPDC101183 TaxID=3364100 RepID=UPI0038271559
MTDARAAVLHTTHGPIHLELFRFHAPKTVRNFAELAEGTRPYTDPRTAAPGTGPYYDGTLLHRVVPGFAVQGGDPTGTGTGGPGYAFADEFHPELAFNRPHLLAMANSGPGTNGSQFFLTLGTPAHLNRRHTIFGQVTGQASKDVLAAIAALPLEGERPLEDVVLTRVTVDRG